MQPIAILGITILIALILMIEKDPEGGLRLSRRAAILKEFWWFIKERKIWWLTPIVVILGVVSVFIVVTEQSVVLPFIYTVF